MTVQLSMPHRPLIEPTHTLAIALLVLAAVLVVGRHVATGDCWMTGHLPGEANPADIAAAVCGGHGP